MKKFMFTGIATLFIAPAFATPTNTSSTFPANGYMQEDYTYTNQATYTNMGVYSDSVDANANYGDCSSGYWCDSSGQHACSSLSGGYNTSAAGSTANTDCYKACTVANANIAHATTVSGNDYYGAGTDTCSATACEAGYSVTGYFGAATIGNTIGQEPLVEVLMGPNEFRIDFTNKGSIIGRAQCSSRAGNPDTWENSGIYNSEGNITDTLSDSSGQYCYCTVDSYTPSGGALLSLPGTWVFVNTFSSANNCNGLCYNRCKDYVEADAGGESSNEGFLAYRSVLFDANSLPGACGLIDITVGPGEYLPTASETVAQCTAGNFCTGLQNPTHYDANNAQGLTACSTLGDHSYTNSAVGASAETDCYKACTTASIAHSATVTGNDYYGAGTDTCSATACENGYHINAGLDLETTIGTDEGTEWVSIRNNGTSGSLSGIANPATYGISGNNSFAVDYGSDKGYITGHGRCSTQSVLTPWYTTKDYTFANDHFTNNLTDETGQNGATNCWCQVDSYTPSNGSAEPLSGPWVFADGSSGSASTCAHDCASGCASSLQSAADGLFFVFRSAVLGSIPAGPATCEANTINIVWSGASAADIAANEAGTVTYGGDIRTPRAATIIPGKVFVGWRFTPLGE